MPCYSESGRDWKEILLDLKYSLIIEDTDDPEFFGFFSPDLEGFTGIGISVEDCLYKAKWGMNEHIELLTEHDLAIPSPNPSPTVLVRNAEPVLAAA